MIHAAQMQHIQAAIAKAHQEATAIKQKSNQQSDGTIQYQIKHRLYYIYKHGLNYIITLIND